MSGFDAARVPELLWYQSINTPSPDREGLWRRLTREHVDNSYSAKASAQLFWRAYQNEYWDLAFELGRQHLDQYPRAKASAKVRFWMGKLHEREGNRQDASRLYSQLLSQNGYSYYALRAKGRLGQLAGAYDPGWSLEHEATELSASDNKGWPLPRAEIMGMHPTMRELMNLNLWQEVIGLLPRDYEERYPALNAWFKGRVAGYPADAIAAASGNLDAQQRNDELLQLAYPMLHGDDVLRAAEKHGVDPLLLFALIRQESRFQPQVESRSGAIGLCQLMPATAREVARRLGESYPSRSKLEDPTYNIELGAKYLSDLMRAFQGQPQLAVAAYNGGPGSVRSWLRRYGRIDPDMFVEKIPYAETRHYVKAVFENYWVYKRLHADSDPALELAAAS
jgi:soluble lytic murein transglycosylase